MAIEIPNFIPAAGCVTQNGGQVTITLGWTQGINRTLCTHASQGQYDIFLDEPLAAAEMSALTTEFGSSVGGFIAVTSITDTHKRVTTANASNTLVNTMSFYVEFRRVPGIPASFVVPVGGIGGS